ncbi:unnamed protein product, partial [Mesorhabditis belari]|uniref:Neurotransmitter-gated ion-channel ligand-binding domain-containing protein n=1 Tax=Mesorhabditis belari TaxID=2138241 RepID=A0AAF3FGY8_9BILA
MFFFFFLYVCVNGEFDYTEYGESAEYSNYLNQATAIRQEVFTTRNYDRYLVPIFGQIPSNYTMSQTERLNVHFMLYYCKLFNLDAESQIFSAEVELKTTWRDPRLVWNPSRFGGVAVIYISPDLLWIPDAQIGNAKVLDPVNGNTMPVAQLHSNGMVFMTTVFYVETSCQINANKFPFDKQNCTLSILSLGLDQKYISLGVEVDRGPKTLGGNGEWVIVDAIPMRYESVSLSANLEVTGFFILINRVPNFYVYVIALPCFILTMLSIVGMFWSPNIKKEQLTKLSIGLTSLVSMTVLLDMLARAIPKTQVFPLLAQVSLGQFGTNLAPNGSFCPSW